MPSEFRIYTIDTFGDYIMNTDFSRKIWFLQNHHTWKPGYSHLIPGRDERYWLESMRTSHIRDRKWADIGQNITTFPSGKIAVCRPINKIPAGITGANTGAICMEHFGNFDQGGDVMTQLHRDAIIAVNAILCMKFDLVPSTSSIVYHHWFNSSGKRFSPETINSGEVQRKALQKSCPGTNFFLKEGNDFKGNTLLSAEANFYPLIRERMAARNTEHSSLVRMQVDASGLNVRKGPSTEFAAIRALRRGSIVQVYESVNGWSRINQSEEEWVRSAYLSNF
ncbi:SH3 domain-containing protein [Flavobacterium sp.]|uniref:SH3 domain-containing protein n=1 Tax=Flavobacterium sp. TaxID=239 RepID=UPI003D0B3320